MITDCSSTYAGAMALSHIHVCVNVTLMDVPKYVSHLSEQLRSQQYLCTMQKRQKIIDMINSSSFVAYSNSKTYIRPRNHFVTWVRHGACCTKPPP